MKKQMIEILNDALVAMSEDAGYEVFYGCHDDQYCYLTDGRTMEGTLTSKITPAQIFESYPSWIRVEETSFSVCGDEYPLEWDIKRIRRRVEDRLRKGCKEEILRAAFSLSVSIL